MSDITKIDQNFAVCSSCGQEGVRFRSWDDPAFRLYGLIPPRDGQPFLRMPADIAAAVNDGTAALNCNTAGGRIRFTTDSPFAIVRAANGGARVFSHMAYTGMAGFDLFATVDGQEIFGGAFIPPIDGGEWESCVTIPGAGMRQVTLNFPLYAGVQSLQIGLADTARVAPPADYAYPLPVVFYGSSITQGGCASRPGNAYQNILTRRIGFDYVNLGFSGSSHGEDAMADYLAGLSMSVLVMDYDHNAPTPEVLRQTHEAMYLKIRARQPELPIIFLSAPRFTVSQWWSERRQVVLDTYARAVAANDRRVFFIDGAAMFTGNVADCWSVDNTHPNDAGFWAMANAIEPTLRRALKGIGYDDCVTV